MENERKIEEISLIELESLAFRQLELFEQVKQSLGLLTQEIQKRRASASTEQKSIPS